MSASISRPNIIFVLSDQHRYASLPWTGVGQVRAPTLARLREEGVSFSRCYSNYPICSTARAMIMSGRWPQEVGFPHCGFELRPTPYSLGALFARAGYETCYIGKWHLHAGPDAGDRHCRYIPPGGGRQGFQHMTLWTESNKHWDAAYYDDPSGARVTYTGYNATGMTDQALGFLREVARRREAARGKKGVSVAQSPHTADRADGEELVPVGAHRSNVEMPLAEQIRQYQGHITAVDRELGRIVDFVESSGLAANTILVYSSDHGDRLGSHGLIRKSYFYAESAQVPFLVWGPGRVPAGVERDTLFSTIDYYPTLLGLAGIEAPPVARGINQADAITRAALPSGAPSALQATRRSAIPHSPSGFARRCRRPCRRYRTLRPDQITGRNHEHSPQHRLPLRRPAACSLSSHERGDAD
jgi:arylsulfatase A-like enzyme